MESSLPCGQRSFFAPKDEQDERGDKDLFTPSGRPLRRRRLVSHRLKGGFFEVFWFGPGKEQPFRRHGFGGFHIFVQ